MNFLVVDDNRLLNRFLVTYLRTKGHGCSALTDGSKAEAWLDGNQCDAIILDIGMPKIDGLSLISIIRQRYRDLPQLIAQVDDGAKAVNTFLSREETYADISPMRLNSNGVTAFISIMRGCEMPECP